MDRPPAVAAVLLRRDRLLGAAAGAGGPAATMRQLAEAWGGVLKGAKYHALFTSLGWFEAGERTDNRLSELAWALAGNLPALKAGDTVTPGAFLAEGTKLPVIVAAARVLPGWGGKESRALVRLRIAAGPGCPATVDAVWGQRAAQFVAYHPEKGFGFSRSARLQYTHPRQFTGCRAYARVTAAGQPKAESVWCTDTQRAFNTALLRMRHREGFKCPNSYTHPCHHCWVGSRKCPASTHETEWVPVQCRACNTRQWADPTWGLGLCLRCVERGAATPGSRVKPTVTTTGVSLPTVPTASTPITPVNTSTGSRTPPGSSSPIDGGG